MAKVSWLPSYILKISNIPLKMLSFWNLEQFVFTHNTWFHYLVVPSKNKVIPLYCDCDGVWLIGATGWCVVVVGYWYVWVFGTS
jgi:hypothetical protein